jgi:hypothetical protein
VIDLAGKHFFIAMNLSIVIDVLYSLSTVEKASPYLKLRVAIKFVVPKA